MNFFCTEKHLELWLVKSGIDQRSVFNLDIKEAAVVGKTIFGKKLQ